MNVETFEKLVLYRYRYLIAYSLLVAVTLTALFFKLGDLVPGISDAEAHAILAHAEAESIKDTVLNPIHSAALWLSLNVFGNTPFGARLPSALIAFLALAMMFITLSIWHKKRIAMVATGLAATSSWFLHTARITTDEIMLPFSLLLIIVTATALHHSKLTKWSLLPAALALSLTLYTPLLIYIILLFLFLYRHEIAEIWSTISIGYKVGMILLIGISTAPLVYNLATDVDLLLSWLGLPNSFPSIGEFVGNINQTFGYLFWRAEPDAAIHLGDLPMLDIFTVSMTALGLYHYEQHQHHHRTRFIVGGFFLSLFVLSLNPTQTNNSLLMPFIFIFAATGVITLLTQWYQIFPRNPIARISALAPLSILLIMVSFYHLERYMLAWPNTPDTIRVYIYDGTALRDDVVSNEASNILVVVSPSNQDVVRASLADLAIEKQFIGYSEIVSQPPTDLVYVPIDVDSADTPPPGYQYFRSLASNSERRPILFNVYHPLEEVDSEQTSEN